MLNKSVDPSYDGFCEFSDVEEFEETCSEEEDEVNVDENESNIQKDNTEEKIKQSLSDDDGNGEVLTKLTLDRLKLALKYRQKQVGVSDFVLKY